MTKLDDFFRTSADTSLHPRLRSWKRRLAQPGVTAKIELYQPGTALGLAPTDINIEFTDNGQCQPLETVAWDDEINTGLIELGIPAVNADQEAERFALGLRGALRIATREVGDGYLNSVLLEFISDSDLTRYPEIAEVLKHSSALRPSHEGKAAARYKYCKEMLASAISGRALELKEKLHYEEDEAKSILVKALARYLDERFSVSSRRQLGLL